MMFTLPYTDSVKRPRALRVVRSSRVLHAVIALATVFGIGRPLALAAPDASKVNDIATFVMCLNMITPAQGQGRGSVADTLQCIPPGCNFTLTMSDQSAQAACTLAGCQLPRVILSCPGPAAGKRFRPSFLLCPTDSKAAGGQFGVDRVELGEDVDNQGSMLKMADVPLPPGMTDFTQFTANGVLSRTGQGNSKGCNSCHTSAGADNAGNELSQPIDPFDSPNAIIDTNEPGKMVDPARKKTLTEICRCINDRQHAIKNAANDPTVVPTPEDRNPNLNMRTLLALCNLLNHKLMARPAHPTPTPTPTPPPPP